MYLGKEGSHVSRLPPFSKDGLPHFSTLTLPAYVDILAMLLIVDIVDNY